MAAAEKLQEMRQKAEGVSRLIKMTLNRVNTQRAFFRQLIGEYAKERTNLFLDGLKARGLSWCTRCDNLFSEGGMKLILVEGRGECRDHFQDFSNLHRVCDECYKRALVRSGTYGKYDTFVKDQTSFFAYPVEKRQDGYYVRRFQNGEWEKLNEQKYTLLADPPIDIIKKLATEFNLPPEIKLSYQGDTIVTL